MPVGRELGWYAKSLIFKALEAQANGAPEETREHYRELVDIMLHERLFIMLCNEPTVVPSEPAEEEPVSVAQPWWRRSRGWFSSILKGPV